MNPEHIFLVASRSRDLEGKPVLKQIIVCAPTENDVHALMPRVKPDMDVVSVTCMKSIYVTLERMKLCLAGQQDDWEILFHTKMEELVSLGKS